MNLVVDTSVWSLLLRRQRHEESNPYLVRLRKILLSENTVFLVGPILLELLDGLRSQTQFESLLSCFTPFPMIEPERDDYIHAARLKNTCREQGIQAGSIDFIIAAVCERRRFPILTADRDFSHISRSSGLLLVSV